MKQRTPHHGRSDGHLLTPVLAFVQRAHAVIRECNHAQRRAVQLRLSPEMYLADRDRAPETYAEFLFRSSAVMTRAARRHPRPSTSSSTRSL